MGGLPPPLRAIGNWPDVRRELEEFFAMHSIGTPVPGPGARFPGTVSETTNEEIQ